MLVTDHRSAQILTLLGIGLGILLQPPVDAFSADSKSDPPVYIELKGQAVDPRSIPSEIRDHVESPQPYEGDLIPSPQKRDELLFQAGLQEAVSEMDHLSRDLLIYHAGHHSLSRLITRYPQLDPLALTRLHQALHSKEKSK